MTKENGEKKPLLKKLKKTHISSSTAASPEEIQALETTKNKYKIKAYFFTFLLCSGILVTTALLKDGDLDYSDQNDSTKIRAFDALLLAEIILAFLATRNALGFYSTKQKLLFRPVDELKSDLSIYKKCTAALASVTILGLAATVVLLATGEINYSDTNYTTKEKLCDAAFLMNFVAIASTILSSIQLYTTRQELQVRYTPSLQV